MHIAYTISGQKRGASVLHRLLGTKYAYAIVATCIVIIRNIVLKDHVIDDSGLIRCTVFGRFYNISLHLYYTTDEHKLQYFQFV